MRLIGTLENENEARRFVTYLKRQGIESNCEVAFDAASGHLSYHLWIRNEDEIEKASIALGRFKEAPSHSEFNVFEPPPPPTTPQFPGQEEKGDGVPKRFRGTLVTRFFLGLCIFVFLMSWYQEQKILLNPAPSGRVLMSPIDEAFFFDLPPNIEETDYWHGAYDWILDKVKGNETKSEEGPLFYRIREGEYWRLFTPVLLHAGLLHILFNMIWLWVLGVPIEQRVGALRTLALTFIIGIGSNVCQYLMGGPFFLGYSGIVVGFAGFIWARERIAPWEGYPLPRSTLLFLLLFVGGMFAIQFTSFVLQIFTEISFSPNIANTGHISGGILGILLGRSHLFSMRLRR